MLKRLEDVWGRSCEVLGRFETYEGLERPLKCMGAFRGRLEAVSSESWCRRVRFWKSNIGITEASASFASNRPRSIFTVMSMSWAPLGRPAGLPGSRKKRSWRGILNIQGYLSFELWLPLAAREAARIRYLSPGRPRGGQRAPQTREKYTWAR